MSTETHLSAPTHVAPAQAAPSAIHVAPAQSRAGSVAPPLSAATANGPDTGPLTWARPTSDGIPQVKPAQPRMRQLMGVCGWAAVLGALGLVIGVRGFIGDLLGHAPGWYEPIMIFTGIIGIGLTVSAFVTVHRRRMPYLLLGAATVTLLTALVLTASAF